MLIKALSLTPEAMKRVLREVRQESYDDRLNPERFSLKEMVAHVADLEDIFLDRMRQAWEYPGTDAPAFDPEERAKEHHYHDKDVYHELEVFENRRRDTVEFLSGLQADDWKKTINHSSWGVLSLEQLASGLVAHDLYHLEQASQYMA